MSIITNTLRAIRFTGLRVVWLSALYSLRRAMGRPAPEPQPADCVLIPGGLLRGEPDASGLTLHYAHAQLRVDFLDPGIVRLDWSPGVSLPPYAIARTQWPDPHLHIRETYSGWRLTSTELDLHLTRDGAVEFSDGQGHLLQRADPPLHSMTDALYPGPAWLARASLPQEACVIGLGEQSGPLNLRGGRFQLWNTDPGGAYGPGDQPIYAPLPVYYTLQPDCGYLIFYENSFPADFQFDADAAPGQAQAWFSGGRLRYYFIPGAPATCLERFSELTGRAPLPPRWSLGYHQSRWSYEDEADVRAVAGGFRQRGWPLSAIHLDIDYMEGFRVFTVDRQCFPDLKQLTADLEQDGGVKLVTIIDPGVKRDPHYQVCQEGLENGYFASDAKGGAYPGVVWPGEAYFPDFTNPAARRWWGDQYPILLSQGIAGIWHDMNEPATFSAVGDPSLPPDVRHIMEGQGSDHRQAHNLYGLLMNRAGYEGLLRHAPQRRPWLLTRSGWVGLPRYAWHWTGDSESSWESLRMALRTVLGLGLCGWPYSGPDIGGFDGNPDAELFTRWFQAASLLPFFRGHASRSAARREPWLYGEPYSEIIGHSLHLRAHLLPYLYTLAWQTSQNGWPLVRPLFWDHPSERRLWEVSDAFLLGDALLAAPVLEAGQIERGVVLPAGEWRDYWSGARYRGPGQVRLEARLETLPLLVRAGTIVPVDVSHSLLQYDLEEDASQEQPLTQPGYQPGLEITPDASGRASGKWYTDAGDGPADAPGRLDEFLLEAVGGAWALSRKSTGDYPYGEGEIELRCRGDFKPVRARVDGEQRPVVEGVLRAPAGFQEIIFWGE